MWQCVPNLLLGKAGQEKDWEKYESKDEECVVVSNIKWFQNQGRKQKWKSIGWWLRYDY